MADGWTLSWLTSRLTVDSIACKDKENKRVFFSLVLCYSTIKKDEVLFSNKDMFNGNKSINPSSFTEKSSIFVCHNTGYSLAYVARGTAVFFHSPVKMLLLVTVVPMLTRHIFSPLLVSPLSFLSSLPISRVSSASRLHYPQLEQFHQLCTI